MICLSHTRTHISLTHLLLLIFLASGCSVPQEREINPLVKASRAVGVEITNRDDFTYPQVTIFVKGNYYSEVGDIKAGETARVPFDKFVDGDGKHFDVETMQPEAIRVRAWFDGKAASKIFKVN